MHFSCFNVILLYFKLLQHLLSYIVNLIVLRLFNMTYVSDVMLGVMNIAELKFTLEKWRKGEFEVSRNDVKRVITVYPNQ